MEIYLEECLSSLEDVTFDGVSLDVFTSPVEPYSEAEEEIMASPLKPQSGVKVVGETIASPLEPQSKVEAVLEAAAKPLQPHKSLIEALALEVAAFPQQPQKSDRGFCHSINSF